MGDTNPSDEDLMLAVRQHDDEEAMARLYERYREALIAYFRKRWSGVRTQEAEDLAYETFFRMLERKESFTGTAASSFKDWLWAQARATARNHARKEKSRQRHQISTQTDASLIEPSTKNGDEKPTVEEQVVQRLEWAALWDCVDRLNELHRQPFRLWLSLLVTGTETTAGDEPERNITRRIARTFGIAEGTAARRIATAKERIRACLKAKGIDFDR